MSKNKMKNFAEKCLFFALNERCNEIKKSVSAEICIKLNGYIPEAKEIWNSAIKTFTEIEKQTKTPFHLIEKTKTYALDGIVIADSLGISKKERFLPLQIFTIYYLAVHLFDDLIEDPIKFGSKFSIKTKDENELHIKAAGVSFSFHVLMAAYKILGSNKNYKAEQINGINQKFTESLARQISYFALEKRQDMTPKKTLEIKQHSVSGEATSFIADCLMMTGSIERKKFEHIKKILFYLGSLTQFTDDIRDYREDKKNYNANLLISMAKENKKNAKNRFIK